MKMNRCDDRGFSLVELIVVVLIMAIVAVALAPQVMKWVENSRLAKDIETRDNLREQCQVAVADNDAYEVIKDGGFTITMTKTGDNKPVFSYTGEDGTPVDPDVDTNAYWENLLKVTGVTNFDDFEDKFTLKSIPADGDSIVLQVIVWQEGHTIATITGISGNDDIKIE